MAQKPFGSRATRRKLETVSDYLSFYTTALGRRFELVYVDAFAGSGEIPHAQGLPLLAETAELAEVVSGSAKRALEVAKPFHRYIFIEKSIPKLRELEALCAGFPHLRDRIDIIAGDANEEVKKFCGALQPQQRAVVFLDPFGNQVRWNTVEAIAHSRKVDLWYLFPAGLGVRRQISKDGRVVREAEASLDDMFGTEEWRPRLIERTQANSRQDLFDDPAETIKIATADEITRFMILRMREIFQGVVLNEWLPLGRHGAHHYSLIFATANPSESARRLAERVARDIMRRK